MIGKAVVRQGPTRGTPEKSAYVKGLSGDAVGLLLTTCVALVRPWAADTPPK